MSQLVGSLGGAHLVQPVVHIRPSRPKTFATNYKRRDNADVAV